MPGPSKSMTRQVAALDTDWFCGEALGAVNAAFLLLDGKSRVRVAGGAIQSLLDYSAKDLTGKPLSLVIPDKAIYEQVKDQLRLRDKIQLPIRVQRGDGQSIPIMLSSAPVTPPDGYPYRQMLLLSPAETALEAQDALAARNAQLATFSRISNLIAEGGELKALMEKLLLISMQILRLPMACIHSLDRRTGFARVVAHRGMPKEIISGIADLPYEPTWIQNHLIEQLPLRLVDWPGLGERLRGKINEARLGDARVSLLVSKGQIFGSLIYLAMNPPNAEDQALLEAIAGQLALAIEKDQLLQDLRESQRKYSTLIEWANDGIMICQDGVFKFVNKRLADMLEYTVSDMVGMDITRIMTIEERDLMLDRYQRRISGRVPKEIYQGDLLSRGGKTVTVEFNATTIEYEGRPASMSFIRDLSERIALQNELIAEKETAEFYNDVLTHDVNNMLHIIVGNMDLLGDEMFGRLNENQEKQRQKALSGARRCANLIDRVRELMTIRHLNPSSFIPLPLPRMLQESLEIVREQFSDTPFTAELSVQPNQFILGHQLAGQIFVNLMSNAIRHNSKEQKWLAISVTDSPDGQHWQIQVEDNGDGIPNLVKQQIYKRYARFSEKGGLGLGMSIVKALVDVMGGSIAMADRSTDNIREGTRFTVTLPKA
ncbi:MAG: PAS domain S-box protein [Myxococcales bacterium]|nr:PAS domain S-box protein [Myxococcales bacterium]